MTYPKGSWKNTATKITYFPNTICAYFHVGSSNDYLKAFDKMHYMDHWNEDRIEYDKDDYLTEKSGNFVKVNK